MNRNFKTIVSSVVIGGMVLTASITANADTSAASSTTTVRKLFVQQLGWNGHDSMGGQKGGKMMTLSADYIKNLVEEGIITQDTADKLTSYIEEKAAEKKAEMEKLKAMTEAERKAYMESKKAEKDTAAGTRKDPFSSLVEEGILTQAQADAIKAYDEEKRQAEKEAQAAKRQEQMEAKLDSLVNAGTITKELKADILEYLNTQEKNRSEERKAEMEKLKAMTDAERKAYMESKKTDISKTETEVRGQRTDQLKELVDNGTLTQDQADAVLKVLFEKPVSEE